MLPKFAMAAALMLLAACGPIQSAQVENQIKAMPGLSKEAVLSCMGPPSKKATEGATEVWTYSSFGPTTTMVSAAGNQNFVAGSASTSQQFCQVNLTMRSDIVVAANYRSQGKLLSPSLPCYSVLNACMVGRLTAAPGQSVSEQTKDAAAFCKNLYSTDARLDPVRGALSLDTPPILAQQHDGSYVTDDQRAALDAVKQNMEQCRSRMATANPQAFRILVGIQPRPFENLTALYDRKITIGEYNTRKQEVLDQYAAAIAKAARWVCDCRQPAADSFPPLSERHTRAAAILGDELHPGFLEG